MRQIIPFKKELLFKTKVSEITSISLEHTLSFSKEGKIIGKFYVTGDYKMTQGSINREKFDFTLPFEIDVESKYKENTITIDIDNFYYEIINDDSLQVNIDVYIDGEKEEIEETSFEGLDTSLENEVRNNNVVEVDVDTEEVVEEKVDASVNEILDEKGVIENNNEEDENNSRDIIMDVKEVEVEKPKKELVLNPEKFMDEEKIDEREVMKNDVKLDSDVENVDYNDKEEVSNKDNNVINIDNDNKILNPNTNINNNFLDKDMQDSDTYATYYVYLVKEDDTIDKILEKYGVTKEIIEDYNDIANIKPGMKLIIPSINE
jgi:hypothetical protein